MRPLYSVTLLRRILVTYVSGSYQRRQETTQRICQHAGPIGNGRMELFFHVFGHYERWEAFQQHVTKPSIEAIVKLANPWRMDFTMDHRILAQTTSDFWFDVLVLHCFFRG